MFNLSNFIMKSIRGMIGNEADYKVMEYSIGWYSKGVLTEDNLAEVDMLIEQKNAPQIEENNYENEEYINDI